jgi:hypothetical protein
MFQGGVFTLPPTARFSEVRAGQSDRDGGSFKERASVLPFVLENSCDRALFGTAVVPATAAARDGLVGPLPLLRSEYLEPHSHADCVCYCPASSAFFFHRAGTSCARQLPPSVNVDDLSAVQRYSTCMKKASRARIAARDFGRAAKWGGTSRAGQIKNRLK